MGEMNCKKKSSIVKKQSLLLERKSIVKDRSLCLSVFSDSSCLSFGFLTLVNGVNE